MATRYVRCLAIAALSAVARAGALSSAEYRLASHLTSYSTPAVAAAPAFLTSEQPVAVPAASATESTTGKTHTVTTQAGRSHIRVEEFQRGPQVIRVHEQRAPTPEVVQVHSPAEPQSVVRVINKAAPPPTVDRVVHRSQETHVVDIAKPPPPPARIVQVVRQPAPMPRFEFYNEDGYDSVHHLDAEPAPATYASHTVLSGPVYAVRPALLSSSSSSSGSTTVQQHHSNVPALSTATTTYHGYAPATAVAYRAPATAVTYHAPAVLKTVHHHSAPSVSYATSYASLVPYSSTSYAYPNTVVLDKRAKSA